MCSVTGTVSLKINSAVLAHEFLFWAKIPVALFRSSCYSGLVVFGEYKEKSMPAEWMGYKVYNKSKLSKYS